jgi:hypothetical protein
LNKVITIGLIHNSILPLKRSHPRSTVPDYYITCLRCPPANFHFTRPRVFPKRAPLHQPNINQKTTKSHKPQGQESRHHVRSHSPHHRPLPRAILPPNRSYPRQSPPAARRDSYHRRWWPDQCFLDKGMVIPEPPKVVCVVRCCDGSRADDEMLCSSGFTPPTQPRSGDHRQSAK